VLLAGVPGESPRTSGSSGRGLLLHAAHELRGGRKRVERICQAGSGSGPSSLRARGLALRKLQPLSRSRDLCDASQRRWSDGEDWIREVGDRTQRHVEGVFVRGPGMTLRTVSHVTGNTAMNYRT